MMGPTLGQPIQPGQCWLIFAPTANDNPVTNPNRGKEFVAFIIVSLRKRNGKGNYPKGTIITL